MDNNRVAVSHSECEGSPKRTLSQDGDRIVVEVICLIDVAGDRGERGDPWPRRSGRPGVSFRFHESYTVQVTTIQMMISSTVTK